jgi:drug/metabolite transporter (DMT)-like permease
MATSRDYLKLHFIVFLWGFSAILGKLITLSAVELIWYRSIIAALGMAIVIQFTRGSFRVSQSDLWRLLGIGAIVAVHWLAFFGAARVSNVSVSLVGFATNSLWAALLEPWFKNERVKKYELFLGLVVIAGLYVIFSFDFEYKLGLLIGVFAGLTSAIFSILNSRLANRVSARAITFYEMIGVVIITGISLPFFAIGGLDIRFPELPSGMDFLYIAILAVVCSVYAFAVAVELMRRVSVFVIQLTLNLEPVYGIIMAVIIFGQQEKMDLNFYTGTLIILSAVIAHPVLRRRFDKTVLID